MWQATRLVKRAFRTPDATFRGKDLFERPSHFACSDLLRLRPFMAAHWRTLGHAIAAMTLATALALPQPLLGKYLVDVVIARGNFGLLHGLALTMILLGVGAAVGGALQNVYFMRFQQDLVCEIQGTLIERVLRLPKALIDSKQTGYLVSRVVSDVSRLQALVSTGIILVIPSTIRLIAGLTFLFWLNWRLSLVALALLPLMLLAAKGCGRRVRGLSRVAMERSAVLHRELQQSLAGVTVIKTFASESRETERLKGVLRASIEAGVDHGVASTVATGALSLVATLSLTFVTWVAAILIIHHTMTLGDFVAFTACLAYVYGPAEGVSTLSVTVQASFAALERVLQLLDVVPEDDDDESKLTVHAVKGRITFDRVSFAYEHGKRALDEVSFATAPGETVAIVGPSGAGKTTLINLLIRLYRPTHGRILVDGADVESINVRSLRERIAVVSQDVFLFDGTIRDNIRYGRPTASDEEVRHAAELASAHGFIEALPGGYDTTAGERGVRLSAGQRQRLSLARAFLKNPDVLILDEPTSALDPLAEGDVKAATASFARGRTTIVVSHRLSTIVGADRILVLAGGTLVQSGTHAELLRSEGLYQRMCHNQLINEGAGDHERPADVDGRQAAVA